jgi:outer membrane protein W
MKKIVFSVILMLGVGFTQVNAQSTSFGMKADANFSNFAVKHGGGLKSKMRTGASLGVFMKSDVTENFAIQPELLFHYKTSVSRAAPISPTFKYWGLEVPVYALGQWHTGSNGRFYAGVGPYVGVGLKSKLELDKKADLFKTKEMQRLDVGAGLLVGYEFASGLQINAGYKRGFLNALDRDRGNMKMFPKTLSVGLGYRF